MKELKGTILEDYMVFRIEGDKIYLLHDPKGDEANTLYLYKHGNFYLARNQMYVLPECPIENIAAIETGKEPETLPENLRLEGEYALFEPRSEYLYALCKDEKFTRLLLTIFE